MPSRVSHGVDKPSRPAYFKTQRRSIHGQPTKAQALEAHNAEVQRIAASVRDFHERGQPFRINHGSTNSTRKGAMNRDPRKTVNTSRLNRVLHVDVDAHTALVEPNVPMDQLVEETLKYGLVPPVVMEFPGITVGGGYAGTSGESSSFKHGFFNRTLKSVEMVLADGEVVVCSEKERADLFHGAAGALGTLGVTTMVEIQLRKASKYVETIYHPVSNIAEAVSQVRAFTSPGSNFDYVDGIMFSPTEGAIITGRMTDTPSANIPTQCFSRAKDPWFYLHVQSRIAESSSSPSQPPSDAIPLAEYLFRYDRGGFWVGRAAYTYFPWVPFNARTRAFLDDFLHTRMMYAALHGSGQGERMIIQDLALPYETAEEFMRFTAKELGIWPLWLCPLLQSPMPTMHPHLPSPGASSAPDGQKHFEGDKQMLNIGVWGLVPEPRSHTSFVALNRRIEDELSRLGGMKWLYAQVFSPSEDGFWKDFDREWYNGLRRKYRAEGLPNVWDKVRGGSDAKATSGGRWCDVWPIGGIMGLWSAIRSRQYLVDRRKGWRD